MKIFLNNEKIKFDKIFIALHGTPAEDGLIQDYFDNLEIPLDSLIGEEGKGWKQVVGELALERSGPERFLSHFTLLDSFINEFRNSLIHSGTKIVGKLISETIEDVSATAMAADVGVQYKFPNDRLTVGVALKNLGSRLQYDGTGLEQQLTPDGTQPGTKDENFAMNSMDSPLPTSLDIAVGYQLSDGVTVMSSFENFSYQLNTLSLGAKYHKGNVWIAAGTKMNVQTGDKPTTLSETSWEDYTESNWGATLGFGVDLEMDATVVSISYAYRQSVEFFEDFSSVEVSFSF